MLIGKLQSMSKVLFIICILASFAVTPVASQTAASRCEAEAALFKSFAAKVSVSIDAPVTLQVGDVITVQWWRGPDAFPLDKPTHIIFAMPDWARFEGKHILPIPPGARVPSDINFGKDQLRVFLSLGASNLPDSGTFNVKVYRAGSFKIDHAVVTKSACGETVFAGRPLDVLTVGTGLAAVVVQDLYGAFLFCGTWSARSGGALLPYPERF